MTGRVAIPRDIPLERFQEQVNKLNTLRGEVAKATEERDKAIRETSEARRQLIEINNDIESKTALRAQLGGESSSLGSLVDGLKVQQAEESGRLSEIQKEIDKAQEELSRLNGEIETKQEVINKTKSTQEDKRISLLKVEKEINEATAELGGITSQIASIRQEMDTYMKIREEDKASRNYAMQKVLKDTRLLNLRARRLTKKAEEIGVHMKY
jgi:chromosome segregation ATPase